MVPRNDSFQFSAEGLFHGRIVDLRVYDRSITTEEVGLLAAMAGR